ncbi:MAG TPA: ABC transporter permease [Pyrinomonadaceae bacterium]|nr:ABC transporter permease [Pyrinomonadaceae bacterium]
MRTLWQDVRFGLRLLWKRPGFTAVALAVLALGVGANTAIFSVVNAVLLRPLPYPGAERVVSFDGVNPSKGIEESNMSAPDFADWREQARSFEALAIYVQGGTNLTGADEPERVTAAWVGPDFFRVIGVGAARGRALLPEDERPGGAAVVISHGLWQRRFGSDPGAVGRTVQLGGRNWEIVGVMPAGFDFPQRAQVWGPLQLDLSDEPRDNRSYNVVGRLREGVTLEAAQAEMDALSARLAAAYAVTNAGWGVDLDPLKDELVGELKTTLFMLLAGVGLLLLIACANVANLLLARATGRRREIALRLALGASRARVARQMLTEGVLLSSAGGALGAALSVWLTDLLVALAPADTPRLAEASADWRVLLFAVAASVLTGVAFGLAPAWQASRYDLNEPLKEGGRGLSGSRSRLRSGLVVAEVALSLLLLAGAGLLVKSFTRLQAVDPGFDPEGVITMRVSLPGARYREPARKAEFYAALTERLKAVPGVEAAGATISLPLGGSNYSVGRGFIREGRPETPEEAQNASYAVVTPDYFRALRVPVRAGRAFDERDNMESTKVVVINEAFARKAFPGEDPLGKRIHIWRDEKFLREVVGVVGDVKPDSLDAKEAALQMYVPHRQDAGWGGLSLVVRARGAEPESLVGRVREEVRALDSQLPVYDVKTLRQVVANSTAYRRVAMFLMAGFACSALLLAGVGLYGVVSYSVAQRTREIGVRLALGAQGRDILGLVVRQGMLLTLLGLGAGLACALALTRLIAGLLYGVSAADPLVYVAVSLLLAAVALLACIIPARRAAKVDPMVALRYE